MRRLICVLLFANSLLVSAQNPFTAPAQNPEFSEIQASSFYVPMKDGVRIAIDVLIPTGLHANRKIPALLKISRFGRAPSDGSILAEDRFWVGHGFAQVLVDERGTGASFGVSRYGTGTISDLREVVDWVVTQPWSNGRVGAIGVSFEGTASELLAATVHPAVRAVAPWFSDYNYYTDLIRPGGVFDDWLMKNMGAFTAQMDSGPAAKRVANDPDGTLLKQALTDHRGNIDIYKATKEAEFIDDRPSELGESLLEMSIPGVRKELTRSQVPMLIFVSWFDAGTVQGTLQRFHDFSNTQRIFIGPWSHGAGFDANPFALPHPVDPSRQQQWLEALRFFNHYLKNVPDAVSSERRLNYYTIGENEWHSTIIWPPAGLHRVAYHLNPDGKLSEKQSDMSQQVKLAVTSTGDKNRWHTQLGGHNVIYTDAMKQMETLTAFTTGPVKTPIEITGQSILRLRMKCSTNDPSVLAYLVAIDPQGKHLYLTEGHLRLLDRKPNTSIHTLHTYRRQDAQPVPQDKEIEADLVMLPISALLPRGYRLQILLASGDSSTFSTSGEYEATIFSSSQIELPIKYRPEYKQADPAKKVR